MAFDSERRVHRSTDVVHRVIEAEAVLLDLKSSRYFGLNATGTAVWEALGTDGATVAEISMVVGKRFDVAAEVLHRDIVDLLVALEREGLIRQET